MIDGLAQNFVLLKKEFARNYDRGSHIQEILPKSSSAFLPINENDLKLMHIFAESNPIYHNTYDQKILDVDCTVYEGDINQYWINSLKNDGSAQPFYPTWLFSAYLVSLMTKSLGFTEIVDVGSGDGRIAFCGKILGLKTYSFEIDEFLTQLQQEISAKTKINFILQCVDALKVDYSSLNLTSPAIFTGGLPQMGDVLASDIIEKITAIEELKTTCCFVLAGSYSKKQINQNYGGWGPVIEKFGLKVIQTLVLPTVWTFDQPKDTPYVFSVSN